MKREKPEMGRFAPVTAPTSKTPEKAGKLSCRTVPGDVWSQLPVWEIPEWDVPVFGGDGWEVEEWEIPEWEVPLFGEEWEIPDFCEGVEWPTPD